MLITLLESECKIDYYYLLLLFFFYNIKDEDDNNDHKNNITVKMKMLFGNKFQEIQGTEDSDEVR